MAITLTENVILLKPFELQDAEKHLAGEDKEQQKWLSGGKSTLQSVQNWIKRNQEYWRNNGPVFCFAIWTTEDNHLIGMVEANTDLGKIEGLKEGEANISYGLYPEARGCGYAVRAINLLTDFLKSKGIRRATIRIKPENINSLKIPLRCEFKETGSMDTEEGRMILFVKDLAELPSYPPTAKASDF